ncbi:hypothetical protein F3Y22_tig00006992pilonHSYRG00028 [Hibiscus syriacus]|uniref:DUF4283 domain-containing protein n=1 Tax=Hibiscus syriacus TaxID=106335 RepID=A0A6A3CGD0_HIBSY|nr:hypothetical protein F3Y22_tig00006992pilonHSYRG00028 [Hibiscus syriacus]
MARKLSKGGKRFGFVSFEKKITSEKELAIVCSVRSIESRLHEWGLGEIKVKRLGGKFFLLIIEDEDLGWSYLKEIFSSIDLWTEKLGALDRATWLEVSRVLLHCWNHTTLKRIAETWGSFEALGENADHSLDCEKVSVLITTKMKKISGPVEIAVEHMVYIALKRAKLVVVEFLRLTRALGLFLEARWVGRAFVLHWIANPLHRPWIFWPSCLEFSSILQQ